MNLILENIVTLMVTISGVVIGGLITLKANSITNAQSLKKEHQLAMLQKIKELLQAWHSHLAKDVIQNFQQQNAAPCITFSLCDALRTLILYFDANPSVLKTFQPDFEKLRKQELSLQLVREKWNSELLILMEKYALQTPESLYDYEDGRKLWDNYASRILEIQKGINAMILSIDLHIEKSILNEKWF